MRIESYFFRVVNEKEYQNLNFRSINNLLIKKAVSREFSQETALLKNQANTIRRLAFLLLRAKQSPST